MTTITGPITDASTEHQITVAEHGARASTLYVYCSCGWQHGGAVLRGVRWETAQRVANEHTRSAS